MVEGICDTGASGGSCIDQAVLAALPPSAYRVITREPSVCVGVNKTPVRVLGKIELNFGFDGELSRRREMFREEFFIVEDLISPIVIGLPFLQKYKAVLDLDSDMMFIGG